MKTKLFFKKKYGLHKKSSNIIAIYASVTIIIITLISASIIFTIKQLTTEKINYQLKNVKTLQALERRIKMLSASSDIQRSMCANPHFITENPEKVIENYNQALQSFGELMTLSLEVSSTAKEKQLAGFIHANRKKVFKRILYIFIFAVIIYIFISMFISKKMLSPIKRLSNFSRFIESSTDAQNNRAYIDKNDDEISHMIEKFNHLMQQTNNHKTKLNQELTKLKKKLEGVNVKKMENLTASVENEKVAALGQLISGIAHELNTPFSVVHSISNDLENRMHDTLGALSALFCQLDKQAERNALALAMKAILAGSKTTSTTETRKTSKALQQAIEQINPALNARKIARDLATIGVDTGSFKTIQNLYKTDLAEDFHQCLYLIGNSKSDVMDLQKSSSRVFHLVKSLKGYASVNNEKTNSSVADGIKDTLAIFQHVLKSDITVTTSFKDTLLVSIHVDSLNQVWTNLINNAVDAIQDKGSINITTKDIDDQVLIEFCDTGGGIPKAIQSKIFELNYSSKKSGFGMGIGLYKSKEIIQAHNGEITFTANDKGTCFKVLLPKSSTE